jgi:ABC-type transporter Mla MlaB component
VFQRTLTLILAKSLLLSDVVQVYVYDQFGRRIALICASLNEGSSQTVRVTVQQTDGRDIVMKIEGRVAGLQVSELQKAWQLLAPSLGQRRLLVDLRGVTHVDSSGHRLLAAIHRGARAEFLADTPLTKYFAEQARQDVGDAAD